MQAVREFMQIKNHELNIKVPLEFKYENVEVIILPSEKQNVTNDNISRKDLQSLSNHSSSTVEEWSDDVEDKVWNKMATTGNSSFDFLNDDTEDIYTLNDGRKVNAEK